MQVALCWSKLPSISAPEGEGGCDGAGGWPRPAAAGSLQMAELRGSRLPGLTPALQPRPPSSLQATFSTSLKNSQKTPAKPRRYFPPLTPNLFVSPPELCWQEEGQVEMVFTWSRLSPCCISAFVFAGKASLMVSQK